jgi:[ribosomal protein S5]-alanine N-acetyltransferase
MTVIFETERLLFREFTIEDAQLVYELNRDPAVTEFTGDPIHSVEQAATVLETRILPQYALYNHGRWATHLKHDLQFIGWCGLKYRPELNEIDLGYRFIQGYWGKGYATEAAWATLQYGFQQLDLQRIVGRAMPENTGSVKVLEKCGMHYIGDEMADGHMARTYELLATDFRNRQ